MKAPLLTLSTLALALFLATTHSPAATPSAATATATPIPTAFHCQVPCGIYGDKMRIDMLMEESATIAKSMKLIETIEGEEAFNRNQMVRWIMTKEEHAASIQETVASYWLAQRVKAPTDRTDADAMTNYYRQLELMHGITVSAMKCKQTIEPTHVDRIRDLAKLFSATYFSEEDQKHLSEHTFGE
ncbi:MAG: superoxide dismutase [Ni] [Planctomycetota bacterium]|jgi:nickel superoxide dismutase|nr:superoxide dismutase [Ni] [Planctomycetota bacterium]MDG2144831.1 superoxide dismutase [Ni] [Planctomycetota bacterium]